jgi:hypothetical protein
VAIVSLLSAKGSPGVTTLAVGLSLAWPVARPGRRSICVDADPVGGDTAAGVLRGAAPADAGMLALATARGVAPLSAVDAAAVRLAPDDSARVIPGVPDAARSSALGLAWDVLVAASDQQGTPDPADPVGPGPSPAGPRVVGPDLVVDAGRVDPDGPVAPWLADSDFVALVVRPTLPAVAAAHRFAAAWSAIGAASAAVPLGLVVVDAPSDYPPGEVAAVVGADLLGVVPFYPAAARVHSDGAGPGRAFARSGYARALLRLARDIGDRAERIGPDRVGAA